MNQLLESFIGEARDLIEASVAAILRLERTPAVKGTIDDLFRAVHTIKGSSGLFEIRPFTDLVHAAEDLLVAVREGRIELTSSRTDLLLEAFDHLSGWLVALEQDEVLPDAAAGIARSRSQVIRASFAAGSATAAPSAVQRERIDAAASATHLGRFTDEVVQRAFAASPRLTGVVYRPAGDCYFRGDDPLATCLAAPGLTALAAIEPQARPPLSELDPFTCDLGFALISTADDDAIEQHFRYVAEEIELVPLVDDPGPPKAIESDAIPRLRADPDLLEILQAQAQLLAGAVDERGPTVAAATTIRNCLGALGIDSAELGLREALAEAFASNRATLRAALEALLHRVHAAPAAAAPAVAIPTPTGEPVAPTEDPAKRGQGMANRMLKVPQEKIDLLMSLVGELVVAKNSLPFLATRAEEVFGARRLGQEIKAQYHVVDRLAQEMQSAVMQIRLLPVGEAFQRFPRLIRDLARKLGKEIELVTVGEETEADKNIIELLSDPLIHLVRNAIDHGVELPEVRRQAGKPAAATIRLEAAREGDSVVVTVRDDGRGIDPAKIREKAIEKGLIDEETAAALSDREAVELVFRPGFSTAEVVSDLSGRGVGMDVVITALKRAGGSVSIDSKVGKGTAVRLAVPLSMTVTRVMIVEVDQSRFGLPMDLVEQTVKIDREAIHTVKHQRVFMLRDQIVPLHRLVDLLSLDTEPLDTPNVAIMVLRLGEDLIGIEVERFREGTDVVVRPLDGILAGLRGFAGTALMGDGQVLLILNPREIL